MLNFQGLGGGEAKGIHGGREGAYAVRSLKVDKVMRGRFHDCTWTLVMGWATHGFRVGFKFAL